LRKRLLSFNSPTYHSPVCFSIFLRLLWWHWPPSQYLPLQHLYPRSSPISHTIILQVPLFMTINIASVPPPLQNKKLSLINNEIPTEAVTTVPATLSHTLRIARARKLHPRLLCDLYIESCVATRGQSSIATVLLLEPIGTGSKSTFYSRLDQEVCYTLPHLCPK
jgi:hypothetical protein